MWGGIVLLETQTDTDYLFLSTKWYPELINHLDISISFDCDTMLISSSNQNGLMIPYYEMATQSVYFREYQIV